jgi:fatty-acid desaturase
MRIVAETVVGILLTFVLMWLIIGGLNSIDSRDPAAEFLSAPSAMFGGFWIALALWVILVILGNVIHRNRSPRARVLHNLLSALGASLINVVVFVVIGFAAGGWAMLLVAIVLTLAIAFLVAAAIAIPVTHLLFFRPRTAATSSATPAPTT